MSQRLSDVGTSCRTMGLNGRRGRPSGDTIPQHVVRDPRYVPTARVQGVNRELAGRSSSAHACSCAQRRGSAALTRRTLPGLPRRRRQLAVALSGTRALRRPNRPRCSTSVNDRTRAARRGGPSSSQRLARAQAPSSRRISATVRRAPRAEGSVSSRGGAAESRAAASSSLLRPVKRPPWDPAYDRTRARAPRRPRRRAD